MQELRTGRAPAGPTRLTWSAFGSGLGYFVCAVYALVFLPAVSLGAVDGTLRTSPIAIGVIGAITLALLPLAAPGLVALWFSPSSAVRSPDNALLPGLTWLGKAAWAGVIFVFAVVFGAVVGVTASGINDLSQRYASCFANPGAAADCRNVVSVVESTGGVNGLYLNELERGTFLPLVTAAVSVAVLLLGIRYTLALKRLIRREAIGGAILAAFDHGRVMRPKVYTRTRAVAAIRYARRWSPVTVFLLGIACAFFVDVYVRWLVIR